MYYFCDFSLFPHVSGCRINTNGANNNIYGVNDFTVLVLLAVALKINGFNCSEIFEYSHFLSRAKHN